VATSELQAPSVQPAEIAAKRFPLARKGYAQEDVQRFLRLVAENLSRLQGEIEWQRARSEHLERRTTAAQEAAYVRLSCDFMDVVRRADEAAGRVRAEAEARAKAEAGSAHREAARLLAAAVEQAEIILTEARSEAQRMLREARGPVPNGSERPQYPLGNEAESEVHAVGDLDVELDVSLLDLFGDV